jgi:carbon monoxide dehydrogenase subunit G
MLRIIAIVVVVAIAAFLAFAATKPDSFRVERSATIQAPPDKIFALIQDFHKWGTWSPYEKRDPEMKRTYGGPDSGKGSVYAWEGNSKVGAGRMEILEASAPSKVAIKLDFIKPFEGHNTAEFTLVPQGDSTNVNWAMYGPNPYFAKVMQSVFNMDEMIGKDFATGLANLKAAAEK